MRSPLNVHVRPGSDAEAEYRRWAFLPPASGAAGEVKRRELDLVFHRGKTIPSLTFTNLYLGGASAWQAGDVEAIDRAIATAMSDAGLNRIMAQYFPSRRVSTTFRPSRVLEAATPRRAAKAAVEALVAELHGSAQLDGFPLGSTVFNLALPSGTVLSDGGAGADADKRGLDEAAADSLHGLGGYHGSVHVDGGRGRVYYTVAVFSEALAGGRDNGVVAFDRPWKNVVATLYHALNEARTDPDVEDAIRAGAPSGTRFLGWASRQGLECGDTPMIEAGCHLELVFKEVEVRGGGRVPVQLMWSNRVHGAQAPPRYRRSTS
jgi:hypothetical protein